VGNIRDEHGSDHTNSLSCPKFRALLTAAYEMWQLVTHVQSEVALAPSLELAPVLGLPAPTN